MEQGQEVNADAPVLPIVKNECHNHVHDMLDLKRLQMLQRSSRLLNACNWPEDYCLGGNLLNKQINCTHAQICGAHVQASTSLKGLGGVDMER